eukprot:6174420-Pleurochrysis_carterae.AAC.2
MSAVVGKGPVLHAINEKNLELLIGFVLLPYPCTAERPKTPRHREQHSPAHKRANTLRIRFRHAHQPHTRARKHTRPAVELVEIDMKRASAIRRSRRLLKQLAIHSRQLLLKRRDRLGLATQVPASKQKNMPINALLEKGLKTSHEAQHARAVASSANIASNGPETKSQ